MTILNPPTQFLNPPTQFLNPSTQFSNPSTQFLNPSTQIAIQTERFLNAKPFPHIVIDHFFSPETANQIAEEFLLYDDEGWHSYLNPIENKKTSNNWNVFSPLLYQVFNQLNSRGFISELESLTVIEQLFADPGLHGGGLHSHSRGGKLNVHLDYSIHPKLKLERRLNLLIYVSQDWKPEWGGGLELWSHDEERNRPKELVKTIDCKFNRAVIFDTGPRSWHGLPNPITCPEGVVRQSLALYYLSKPRPNASKRGRALFVPTKQQESDPEVQELIRKRASVETSAEVYRIGNSRLNRKY